MPVNGFNGLETDLARSHGPTDTQTKGDTMTPGTRFYARCKELGIDLTMYGIHCPTHGQMPAVYDSNTNNYDCRTCMYHHIMDRTGKYHFV